MILVCGEALIDLIQQHNGSYVAHPGGSPANTAIALAKLGISTQLITHVGNDAFGNQLRAGFEAANINTSLITTSAQPTTLAVATLDKQNNATYDFYVDDSWTTISDVDGDVLVISGSLALPVTSMFNAIDDLLQRFEKTVVFDLNIRPALATNRDEMLQRMNKWIARADIVKASTDDIAWAYPGQSTEDVLQQWINDGATLAFVTDGGVGAWGQNQKESARREAPPVEVVDTVGAGDTFTAGLISRLSADLETQLSFAVELASDACTHAGAPTARAKS